MIIVGISAFYHDSAISIIKDGKVIFASHEERYNRIKNYKDFPFEALTSGLRYCNIKIDEIDKFIFYEKPLVKFERILKSFIHVSPQGFNQFKIFFNEWTSGKLFLRKRIKKNICLLDNTIKESRIYFSEHHLSHAASAFFPSPFDESIIIVNDAVGEFSSTSISIGKKNKIEQKYHIDYPDSIGMLYSAFTHFLGFKVNSDEYKVMGLAPFGLPKYKHLIFNHLIDLKNDGSYSLNQNYFTYLSSMQMVGKEFENLFGCKIRKKNEEILQIHKDIAASIQKTLEEILLLIVNFAYNKFRIDNLTLAGGIALNCVANSYLLNNSNFKKIWIQPASGDSGGSLGAALAYYHMHLNKQRILEDEDSMKLSFLGLKYNDSEIEEILNDRKISFIKFDDEKLIYEISQQIIKDKIIGIFRGRSEFGPRALGNRSIICNAKNKNMKQILNKKIKFREGFRPFAGMILNEYLGEYYDVPFEESQYMIMVGYLKHKYRKPPPFPSIVHEDFSTRLQTISKKNKFYYELLQNLNKSMGIPVLINTSFNVKDEPIVESPDDALNTFFKSDIDTLFIENFMIKKL